MGNKPGHQDTMRTIAEARLADGPKSEPHPAEELLHELQVHQIELEMQNDALRHAQTALEESRDRYVELYDFAPVGYLTVNRGGMIGEANLTAAALLGMERSKLRRRRFSSFVAAEDRDRWHRFFLSILERDNKLSCELEFQRVDGTYFFAQLDCLCMKQAGKEPVIRTVLTDITQRRQAEEEFRGFFNLIPDLACIASTNGYFLKINPMWQETLGYTMEEILATPYIELIHPDDRDATIAEVKRQLDGNSAMQFINRYRCKDGSYKWLEWRAAPVDDRNMLFASARDITDRMRLEQTLIDLDQRKDAFLAMLAHELRNPLVPIRNAAHVLGQLELTEPRARWAQRIIEEQTNHLVRMVDDLLDVSRIARNKIKLKKESIVLAVLVEGVIESARPLAERKGHRLTLRLPEQPVHLEGDPVRLSQALFNLVDNAIKYTPDGGQIELAARMAGQEVEISVRDSGMGITAELLPYVFELFQQDERTLDRSQGGLGIGLTLVRRLVGMHGGRIKAYSEGPGAGSTFTVWLPAQAISAQPAAPEAVDKSGPIPSVRVLVVDDDYHVASSTAVVLELDGHEVRVAHTGQAALEMVPSFRSQVVLLDIGLKDMDGFETARRLRELPQGRELCLVAVTGYGDEKIRTRALASGCDHFLVKPVAYDTLSALLSSAAGKPC